VDVAVAGGSFGAASALGITGITTSSAAAGGVGGYISGGWNDVLNGVAIGAFAGPVLGVATFSVAAAGAYFDLGAGLTKAAQVATVVGGDAATGGVSTMMNNDLDGQPIMTGVLKSALFGATAPLLSAEVILVAAGETGPAATVFNIYTGLLNSVMTYADAHSQESSSH